MGTTILLTAAGLIALISFVWAIKSLSKAGLLSQENAHLKAVHYNYENAGITTVFASFMKEFRRLSTRIMDAHLLIERGEFDSDMFRKEFTDIYNDITRFIEKYKLGETAFMSSFDSFMLGALLHGLKGLEAAFQEHLDREKLKKAKEFTFTRFAEENIELTPEEKEELEKSSNLMDLLMTSAKVMSRFHENCTEDNCVHNEEQNTSESGEVSATDSVTEDKTPEVTAETNENTVS